MYAPVPLPSSHIEPPWKSEVMKASRIGEIAKIKPVLMNGKRIIERVYGATKKDHPSNAEVVFYLCQSLVI